ncbi:hypothetical protein [Algoriphagus sp.]|uniref:hypothetical protein n=1 Tax=Algoriphagus sp. TaxID=1872435 RepID=UPI00391915BB
MNITSPIFLMFFLLIFSCGEKEKPGSDIGKVTISGMELTKSTNPSGRTLATSQWKHIFSNQLNLTFTGSGGETFSLSLDPNDFSKSYTIDLPFGTYEYSGASTAQALSSTLPVNVSGQLVVDNTNESLLLKASSDYGLFTFSKPELSTAPKILEPQAGTLSSTSDFYYTYVKGNELLKTEIPLSNGKSFRIVAPARSFFHQQYQFSSSSTGTPDSFQKVDFDVASERLVLGGNGYPSILFPYRIHELGTALNETSGLQRIQGRLFSINDSGNSAEIQEINPASGSLIRTIKVTNAPNIDWEDLASSSTHLFIGDFGNNVGNRTDLKILKIPISNLLNQTEVTAEIIEFSYPDQSDFSGSNANHNFDCEAMIFRDNQLHLFSKNWGDERTKHYTLSPTVGKQVAAFQENFDSKGLITGADVSPDGKNVILLGYENKGISSRSFVWTFASVTGSIFSGSGNQFFLGSPAGLGQTEGISIDSKMELTISGERISFSGLTVPPRLFKVDVGGIFTP